MSITAASARPSMPGIPDRGRQDFGVTVGYTVTAPPGTHVTVGGFATETTVKGIKGDVSVELVVRNDRHLGRRTRLVSQDAFRHDLHQLTSRATAT